MVSLVGLALTIALFGGHTLAAAVMTRFFRLRLNTSWGWMLYTALLTPIVLLVSTLLFSGGLGIGIDLGSPEAVVAALIVVPTVLGATIDYLYMPPPDEYELPEPAEQ